LFFFPLGVWLFLPPFTLTLPACLLSAFSTPGATVKPREQAQDTADSYDPSNDSSSTDTAEFSPAEIAQVAEQVHNLGLHLGQGGPSASGLPVQLPTAAASAPKYFSQFL
jgi:hypothetical protein